MFVDRTDAGHRLATRLAECHLDAPVVLALPRGGVPVAEPVARLLGAPLDILGVHKIGAPGNPELAIGAVGEGGVVDVDVRWRDSLGPAEIERLVAAARVDVDRRLAGYAGVRPVVSVAGRTVILVDDGLATGATAMAAVRVARAAGACYVVVAAPVGSSSAVRALALLADDVVCLEVRERFVAVGLYYEDFGQVSDDEVREGLLQARP